jgi:hypothetical protein
MAGVVYNKFKYNNTSDVNQNCCIRKFGTYYDIGVSKSFDYGPTYITDFWNGVNLAAGSLASFQYKPFQGPSIYITNTNAEFVGFANNLNIGTFTGTSQALSYIASGQTDIVVTNINYPEIQTQSLRLLLDAGYTASYPWQDNIVYDISSQHGNGTLSGGTTWFSAGTNYASSYFSFNRATQSQFIEVGGFISQLNNFTLQVWVNFNTTYTSDEINIVSEVPIGYSNSNYFITLDTSGQVIGGFKVGGTITSVVIDPTPATNNWVLYSLTYDGNELKGYKDNSSTNSVANSSFLQNDSQPIIIGGTTNNTTGNGANNYFDGKIGVVLLYDSAFDLATIQSNYSAYKNTRY